MKFICVAKNYDPNQTQLNQWMRSDPVLFLKPGSALLDKDRPIIYETHYRNLVHELELVYLISKRGRHIGLSDAKKHYDQVTVGIDLSDRAKQ